jgi:hypothetical protein
MFYLQYRKLEYISFYQLAVAKQRYHSGDVKSLEVIATLFGLPIHLTAGPFLNLSVGTYSKVCQNNTLFIIIKRDEL